MIKRKGSLSLWTSAVVLVAMGLCFFFISLIVRHDLLVWAKETHADSKMALHAELSQVIFKVFLKLFLVFLSISLVVVYILMKKIQEKTQIRELLDRVVSKEVASEILKAPFHLGGEDRVVTMLFSDIRGFTSLSQTLEPQEIIALLNEYMTLMSRVIEGEGGIIDKFVGDEIMALFGAPLKMEDHALKALSTAQLMMSWLKTWNEKREAEGKPLVEMGIGVHTGVVVIGNMGTEDRLNYTAIGANVNLAARLCQMAAPRQILLSESTLQQPLIRDSFYVKELPPITPKGFSAPVSIYEITGFKWEES